MSDGDAELIRRAEQRVGTTLKDKWTIDKLLGVGGMAVVYAATHRNKKRVAIKMLHPELSVDADIKARFLREGYVANTVDHPGAVKVDDDDVAEDGAAFLVMELLQGETVQARCERKGGPLPVDDVLSIAGQLLDVLASAHDKGIVHRDLKPENLFLDRGGQLKVLDFGIARLRETKERSGTRTGSLMGTPSFMPPEQARGRWDEVDARTDLWAVGATMYTLLTGRLVHEAETANEALALAITQRAPALASVVPDVPPAVAMIVDRALCYEKEGRFPDAATMQAAVREAYAALHDDSASMRMPALSVPDTAGAGTMVALSSPTPAASAATAAAASVGVSASPTTAGVVTRQRPAPATPRRLPLVPIAVALGVVLIAVVGIAIATRPSSSGPAAASGPAASSPVSQEPAKHVEPVVTPSTASAPDEQGAISVDELPNAEKRKKPVKTVPTAIAPPAPPAGNPPPPGTAAKPAPKPVAKPADDPFAKRR